MRDAAPAAANSQPTQRTSPPWWPLISKPCSHANSMVDTSRAAAWRPSAAAAASEGTLPSRVGTSPCRELGHGRYGSKCVWSTARSQTAMLWCPMPPDLLGLAKQAQC